MVELWLEQGGMEGNTANVSLKHCKCLPSLPFAAELFLNSLSQPYSLEEQEQMLSCLSIDSPFVSDASEKVSGDGWGVAGWHPWQNWGLWPMKIWNFSSLLLLSDTQFAGKKVLLVPSGVLRVVAVLWFPVQHGSCPPEPLLCCVLTWSFKSVEAENLSSLNPVCAGEGAGEAVMEVGAAPSSCAGPSSWPWAPVGGLGKDQESRTGKQTQILDIHSHIYSPWTYFNPLIIMNT